MVRSRSHSRYDHHSPGLESPSDPYDRDTLRSMKKSPYTSGRNELYSTPPNSSNSGRPSSRDGRSRSRSRLAGATQDNSRDHPYTATERDYEDHRNPISEGRDQGTRSRYYSSSIDDDDADDHSIDGPSSAQHASSAAHARDVLSKMRSRNLGSRMNGLAMASPRRRLDMHTSSHSSPAVVNDDYNRQHDDYTRQHDDNNYENQTASRYELLGMKEELKKKDVEVMALRQDQEEMSIKYEENMAAVRTKLVSTFKGDMHEMKAEWEEAFQHLKDESDTTQRAMDLELSEVTGLKADVESELVELKAEYRSQMDLEKSRAKEGMEELKRSKEEDLERLRSMYEEHLDGTKKTAADVEGELKEEVHMLCEENERVKMCYENLEKNLQGELERYKADLEEVNSSYQKTVGENIRWEKEVVSIKNELNDVMDENDQRAHQGKVLETNLNNTKSEMERISSQYQRSQAEKARFEKEYNAAAKDRDTASAGYDDMVKKLDSIQEERTLESRYTEALVKQRDNMNDIIENSQQEIDELKSMNAEMSGTNKGYAALSKEFNLPNSDASTLAEELAKADKLKERLESLGRERERYNATVKALKVDLKALHAVNVGPETSLQEHMRLLNEKWDSTTSRVKQIDKLKHELGESIQLLEENAKDREHMMREHHGRVGTLERDVHETQTSLVKMEREKMIMADKLSDFETLNDKMKDTQEEMKIKCGQLQERLDYTEDKCNEQELQIKSLDSDNRSMEAELNKVQTKRNDFEDSLDKMEDVKKGLKKKLESAYYELEETQRELTSIRRDHNDEIRTYEAEISKFSERDDKEMRSHEANQSKLESQDEEIKTLKEMLTRLQTEHDQDIEDAQNEVTESFKSQLRLLEEKHNDQDRRNNVYLEQKHNDDIDDLRMRNKKLEHDMKEQKGSLDQKSMVEIKRRGEFAKQKQELEILRSKERHLETHVNQLEEHISKVVADYETKLQDSTQTVCTNSNEEKVLKKLVRELEKKLEVSSAAMKQIGKSSLLMEKENERLKHDKNQLKLKLRKLVDCAEKFGPK